MKILVSGCLLLVSPIWIAGCHGAESTPQAAVETAAAHLVESRQQQVPIDLRATGTVHAQETATISAQVMGRIEQVLVREGDSVRAGQTLAILDGATLRDSANQAQAAVTAAQQQQAAAESNAQLAASTLKRYQQLEVEKSVSPQEMDEVERRSQAAQAQLNAARAQTQAAQAQASGARAMAGYARLVSPFNGIVTARMADPGTLASPGMPLLTVDRAGPLELDATIDESAIAGVRTGMKVEVTLDGDSSTQIEGTVRQIVPAADPSSRSFLIKIALPSSTQLHAGVYGTASIPSGTREAIVVPNSAVIARGSLVYAYVLDAQGIAGLRYLTLGDIHGDLVEVLSGIAPGEKLIDAPLDRDFAGKRIEVLP